MQENSNIVWTNENGENKLTQLAQDLNRFGVKVTNDQGMVRSLWVIIQECSEALVDVQKFYNNLINNPCAQKYIPNRNYPEPRKMMTPVARGSMEMKKVIFNHPATIILWADGTKTVVKVQDGEDFDCEKGVALAILKKLAGNKGNYFNPIKQALEQADYIGEEVPLMDEESIFGESIFGNLFRY